MTKKSQIDHKKISALSEELTDFVHKIQGLYLDSMVGYGFIINNIISSQKQLKELLKDSPDVTSDEFLDKLIFNHSNLHGREFAASGIHFVKNGEVKKRNKEGGENHKFIANMCVVMLYAYWEHYLRGKLEKAYHLPKGGLQDAFWGNLNWLRQDILHNKGKCKNSKKAKILCWFKVGQEIKLDQDKMRTIFLEALRYRNKISSDSSPEIYSKIPYIERKQGQKDF